MQNTLEKAKFRILVYKSKKGYVGICYETGWVEIYPTQEEVIKHISDGISSLIETSKANSFGSKNLNRKPTLKYQFIFHTLPAVATFKKSLDFSFITKPEWYKTKEVVPDAKT